MFSFKHAAAVVESTRQFDLGVPTSPGAPSVVLVVKHAGESNAGFHNAMFKRLNTAEARARSASVRYAPEQVAENRTAAVDLYAQHVVVGWDHVLEDGKPVEFSPDAAHRMLTALVDPVNGRPDVFAELRAFCETPGNFLAPIVAAVALGKK